MRYTLLNCKQLRAYNCRQNFAILSLLIAALALLFGCTQGVPQEKYDSLAASCAQQNATLQGEISSANSAVENAQAGLSDCVAGRQAAEGLIDAKDAEIALLRNESDILAAARQKTAAISQYDTLMVYYNDAYGVGAILNTAKLNRISAQVALLGNAALSSSWDGVKGCQTSSGCDNAKAAFLAEIDAAVALLNAQVAAIVAE